MTKEPEFSVVIPPNTLKQKAERPGGITRNQAAELAAAVVTQAAAEYRAISLADIDEVDALLPACLTRGGEAVEHRRRLYRKAHDLWSLGETFGYPLVTEIADSLCRYLGPTMEADTLDGPVVMLHAQALRLVIGQGITGSGRRAEHEMVDGLRRAVAKALGRS